MGRELATERLFRSDQQNAHARIMPGGQQCTFYLRFRSPVRTHCIDSYDGFHECLRLLRFLDFHDFTPFVVAAFGAGAMRELVLVAIGALGNGVGYKVIVSAASRRTSLRVPPFWIRHLGSLSIQRVHRATALKIFAFP